MALCRLRALYWAGGAAAPGHGDGADVADGAQRPLARARRLRRPPPRPVRSTVYPVSPLQACLVPANGTPLSSEPFVPVCSRPVPLTQTRQTRMYRRMMAPICPSRRGPLSTPPPPPIHLSQRGGQQPLRGPVRRPRHQGRQRSGRPHGRARHDGQRPAGRAAEPGPRLP